MRNSCFLLIGLLGLIMLSSCFRKDERIALLPPGEAHVTTVDQGSDYMHQIYFDMNNGVVLRNNFSEWDLSFETSASGFHVWINGGKDMYAAKKNESDFYAVQTATGVKWRWDSPTGNTDSTAIGNWTTFIPSSTQTPTSPNKMSEMQHEDGFIYIIDRGSMYGTALRFWKVKFLWVNSEAYKIKFGLLDNSLVDSMIILKDKQFNFSYFTFNNGGQQITMEPPKQTWDIVFTRYRYVFYNTNPYTPYMVSGVLLNPNGIYAGADSTLTFEEIDYEKALTIPLTTSRDVVGYDWKRYSFASQSYLIAPQHNYIIRDENGYYWKLRFIDFYNADGEKGYPKFEYQRL